MEGDLFSVLADMMLPEMCVKIIRFFIFLFIFLNYFTAVGGPKEDICGHKWYSFGI